MWGMIFVIWVVIIMMGFAFLVITCKVYDREAETKQLLEFLEREGLGKLRTEFETLRAMGQDIRKRLDA